MLPRTETGKVDRLALPTPASVVREAVRPEADALEETVCAIWRDVLSVEAVGPDDNFFSLGGHSLLAIRAAARIRTVFGVDLPLRSFFNAPTLRHVARLIAESPTAGPGAEEETRSQPAVLAPAQEAIWFAEQLRPGTSMHNHSEAFLISGEIDVDVLEAALNRIASRHDVLRTAYRPERAGVRAVVLDGRFPLLRIIETAGSEETIAHHIREEIRKPFRLASEWPVRARWVDLSPDRSLLILTAHHIAYDGWSHSIFLTELSRHYEAIATSSASEPDPPRRQYADLARLQLESLIEERVDQARQTWSKHLETVDWNRSLPGGDRANRDDIGAASQAFTIDSAATAAIQSCTRALRVTPFAILLAGFRCALGKWTGYRDDCVGIVAAARPEAFAETIGLFSNPLPLLVPILPELTFQEWVKRCQEKVAEVLSMQDVPIARALAGLRPGSEPRPEPPFEVTFALQESASGAPLRLLGADVRSVAAETESATFPLQFFLTSSGQILRGEVIYRRGWLRPETVAPLIRWFAGIVGRGAGNPGISLHALIKENTEMTTGVSRGSRRRLLAKAQTAVSRTSLTGDAQGPVLISPSFRDVDLAAWVRTNSDETRAVLRQHGAVLFRGFEAVDAGRFEEVATSVAGELVRYVEGSSPRRRLGRGLYTSTEYPRELPISMHNELSYAHWWPRYLFFYCRVAAETGGETPLADSRAVLQYLPPSIVEKFRAHGVRYLRRLRGEGPGLGLSWQEVFETDDREAVERYCRDGEIAFEWARDGGLRTRQDRHALINHPETGQLCWFNQVHQWHSSNLSPEDARIVAALPPEERPLDATYGDGSEFDEETLAAIREAYVSCQVTFQWQAGDIVAVDNMAFAHGRRPFTGPREILVLLGGRVTASDVFL
jgi:alpha-ketoglutarate-dependent taurine dioxygenase